MFVLPLQQAHFLSCPLKFHNIVVFFGGDPRPAGGTKQPTYRSCLSPAPYIYYYIYWCIYTGQTFLYIEVLFSYRSRLCLCTHTHSPVCISSGRRAKKCILFNKNKTPHTHTQKKPVSDSAHFQRDFWVCHDFLLVFLYKIYKRGGQPCSIVVCIYIGGLDVQRGHNLTSHSVYSIYPHAS